MAHLNDENIHLKNKMQHLKVTEDEKKIKNENQQIESNIEHFSRFLEIDGLPNNLICSRRQFLFEIDVLLLAASGEFQKYSNNTVRLAFFNDVLVICTFNRVERSQSPLVCLQPNTDTLPRPKKRVSMPSAGLCYGKAYKYLKHLPIEDITAIGRFSFEENQPGYVFCTANLAWIAYSSNSDVFSQMVEKIQRNVCSLFINKKNLQSQVKTKEVAEFGQKELLKYFSPNEVANIIKSLKSETSRSKTPEEVPEEKKLDRKSKTPVDFLDKKRRLSTGKYFMIYKESDSLREEVNNKIAHFTRFLDIENLPSQLICSNRQFMHELDATSVFGTCDFEDLKEIEVRLVIFTDVLIICEVNKENRSSNFGQHPMAVDTPTRLRKQVSMPALGRNLKKSLKYLKHVELKSFRKIQNLGEMPSNIFENKDILVLTITEGLRESLWVIHTKNKYLADKTLNYIQNYVNMKCKRDVHSLIPYPYEYLLFFVKGNSLEQYLQRQDHSFHFYEGISRITGCVTPKR